jgi:hypothetical protein
MRAGWPAGLGRGGEDQGAEIERDVIVLNKIQEDHEFIVTRATSAIALHLLCTDPTQQHHSQSGF